MSFLSVVKEKLGPDAFKGSTAVDVGCLRFADSIVMKDLGAKVIALDILKRTEPPEGISFVLEDFLKWEPQEKIDILYMSNSVLFMPVEEAFKKIETIMPRTIAVRTMYRHPIPNWEASELKPLYFTTPEDWKTRFEPLGYKTIHGHKYESNTKDLKGRIRLFFFTEYIGIYAPR
jgi:hypothetical protein